MCQACAGCFASLLLFHLSPNHPVKNPRVQCSSWGIEGFTVMWEGRRSPGTWEYILSRPARPGCPLGTVNTGIVGHFHEDLPGTGRDFQQNKTRQNRKRHTMLAHSPAFLEGESECGGSKYAPRKAEIQHDGWARDRSS